VEEWLGQKMRGGWLRKCLRRNGKAGINEEEWLGRNIWGKKVREEWLGRNGWEGMVAEEWWRNGCGGIVGE
jgi:hypothetical protein